MWQVGHRAGRAPSPISVQVRAHSGAGGGTWKDSKHAIDDSPCTYLLARTAAPDSEEREKGASAVGVERREGSWMAEMVFRAVRSASRLQPMRCIESRFTTAGLVRVLQWCAETDCSRRMAAGWRATGQTRELSSWLTVRNSVPRITKLLQP